MVVSSGSNRYFYRISSYTDANNITLNSNFALATGSYNVEIFRGWVDRWKDFGSDLSGSNADGYDQYIPCEVYEDTVLFGRKNNITSLSTVTDTVTTDASPAFTMPTGFDCLAIHRGSNGILMGFNFQGKGYLVLWDNYSDRAIAPWIPLNDRLISLCKITEIGLRLLLENSLRQMATRSHRLPTKFLTWILTHLHHKTFHRLHTLLKRNCTS